MALAGHQFTILLPRPARSENYRIKPLTSMSLTTEILRVSLALSLPMVATTDN